jgi:hypothetical protein
MEEAFKNMETEPPKLEKVPTSQDLEIFRQEIEKIYETERLAEKDGNPTTGHFKDPFDTGIAFDRDGLGPKEFLVWQSTQQCLRGEKPANQCRDIINSYKRSIANDPPNLARMGVVSYASGRIGVLIARAELEQERAKRTNSTSN